MMGSGKMLLIVTFFGSAMTLVGCGSTTHYTQPGNSDAYQSQVDSNGNTNESSNCSEQFVSDYDDVIEAIKTSVGDAKEVLYDVEDQESTASDEGDFLRDTSEAQTLVNQFNSSYRDVVCDAVTNSADDFDQTPTTIDVDSKVTQWNHQLSEIRTSMTSALNIAGTSD